MELIALFMALLVVACLGMAVASRRQRSRCYLLDYICYKPPDDSKASTETILAVMDRRKRQRVPVRRFFLRVILHSGLGEHTYCPRSILAGREESLTHQDTHDEMDAFFHDAVAELFARTRLSARDVVALLGRLASRIVRAYGMREDVAAYNLSGMGCSAVLVAVDVSRNTMLARAPRPELALVVSAESIVPNWYGGEDRSMILGHCLFRCGGSAKLLTSDPALHGRAKMELRRMVRSTIAADDDAHSAIVQREDADGLVGISLSKSLPKVAVRAFTTNMKRLAPYILPVR